MGKQPDLSRMMIFGSQCFAYVKKPSKLSDRAEEGIFVGYDKESPAYLVYFPENQKVKTVRCIKSVKPTTVGEFDQNEEGNLHDLLIPEETTIREEDEISQSDENVPVAVMPNVTNFAGQSQHLAISPAAPPGNL
jgi:hypothetical protein